MRPRADILKDARVELDNSPIVEVLLDIRDLLIFQREEKDAVDAGFYKWQERKVTHDPRGYAKPWYVWRDAEKEKPEAGNTVLLRSDGSGYVFRGYWNRDHWKNDDGRVWEPGVTHWMPLPPFDNA